jgi:anaerobic selenocysteine-containing dehydrogenase
LFCENGAKATAWEITSKRCGPEFFRAHKVGDLERWPDHDLEEVGRLICPIRYDQTSNRYREIEWEEAFAEIGRALKNFDPSSAVFYTSGRASLEAFYVGGVLYVSIVHADVSIVHADVRLEQPA